MRVELSIILGIVLTCAVYELVAKFSRTVDARIRGDIK